MSTRKIGRNDACPCGSGAKYKRCCLSKDDAERRSSVATAATPLAARGPPGSRVVERGGEQFLVSRGVSDERIAEAAEYFERRDRLGGPAQQMEDFIEPLLRMTDGGPEAMRRMWSLGMLCWNIALLDGEEAQQAAVLHAEGLFRDEARGEFRELVAYMVRRHRELFPEMHVRARAG